MAGRFPHQVAAAAMAGMGLTDETAFLQDLQRAVNGYQADAGVLWLDAFKNSRRRLVFVRTDNLFDDGPALGRNLITMVP